METRRDRIPAAEIGFGRSPVFAVAREEVSAPRAAAVTGARGGVAVIRRPAETADGVRKRSKAGAG